MSGRLVSVFGPFASRALVEIPVGDVAEVCGVEPGDASPHNVIDAVLRDLDAMPEELSSSTAAAVAVALAYDLEHPYNSATSKSMVAARLNETMAALRALAPPERKVDSIDQLAAARKARRAAVAAGGSAPADLPRS